MSQRGEQPFPSVAVVPRASQAAFLAGCWDPPRHSFPSSDKPCFLSPFWLSTSDSVCCTLFPRCTLRTKGPRTARPAITWLPHGPLCPTRPPDLVVNHPMLGSVRVCRHPMSGQLLLTPRARGARRYTAPRDFRWCWTGVAAWSRVVLQGYPGAMASERATGKVGGISNCRLRAQRQEGTHLAYGSGRVCVDACG